MSSTPTTPRRGSRRRAFAVATAVAALGTGAFVTTTAAADDGEHKVTLCHATASRSNPYVQITVDYHSIVQKGHGSHEGAVFSPDMPRNVKWGDVIPAFDLGPDARYEGMNTGPEGQALLDGGCDPSGPVPSTTSTAPTSTSTSMQPL